MKDWSHFKILPLRYLKMTGCLVYCCIIVILVNEITGQGNCGSWGTSSSSIVTTSLGSATGRAYISTYQVGCTGTVSAWEFYARAYGTIYLQIWRRYSSATSDYTLIGQNQITITAGTSYQEQDTIIPVPPDMRISAKSGDYIGWMTTGSEMVTYGTGSTVYYISASPAIGSTYSFTFSESRKYSVKSHMDISLTPAFTNILTNLEVDRTVSTGTALFTLTAKDRDANEVLTLSTSSISTGLSFNSASGAVSTSGTLLQTSYSVTATVTDERGYNSTQTISIVAFNHAPKITNLPACITRSEDIATNENIFTLTVTDEDGDTVTCTLSTIAPSGRTYSISGYAISDNGGGSQYDYDATPHFRIEVTCSDGKGGSSISALHIDLTKNNPPVFTNLPGYSYQTAQTNVCRRIMRRQIWIYADCSRTYLISVHLPYGFVNIGVSNYTNIFTVGVTDTDNTVPGQITYNMSSVTSSWNYYIQSGGVITTNNTLSNVGENLVITVSDYDTTITAYLSTIISGYNYVPFIMNLPLSDPMHVMENTPVGTTLYVVQFGDLNQDQTLTLSVISYAPSSVPTYYSVNTTTGVITLTASIDYDSIPSSSMDITFRVSDGLSYQDYIFATAIKNVNEAPSFVNSIYSISRNEGVYGDALSSPGFNVSDPDSPDSIAYSLDCGDYTKYFSMSKTTSQVTFARDYSRDSGLPETVKCVVTAKDSGFLSATTNLTITINQINDHNPVCGKNTYFFILDNSVGNLTILGDVSASDADSDMYGSTNGNLTYTLLDSASLYFYINASSRLLSTISSLTTFDKGSYTSFRLRVEDAGGKTATCTVSILFPAEQVTTTTTTETPIPFQKDSRNMVWMTLTGMALITLLVVIICILSRTEAMKQCFAPTNINRPQSPRYQKRKPPRRAGRYGGKKPLDILELESTDITKTEITKSPTKSVTETGSKVKSRTLDSQPVPPESIDENIHKLKEPNHEIQSPVSTRNEALVPFSVGWQNF